MATRVGMARYSKQCPACGHVFHASEVPLGRRSFPCPNCGKELEYAFQFVKTVSIISLLISASIPFALGIQGLRGFGVAILSYPFVWLACILSVDQIRPPLMKLREY